MQSFFKKKKESSKIVSFK